MDVLNSIFSSIIYAINTFVSYGKSALIAISIIGALFITGAVLLKLFDIKNKSFYKRQLSKSVCMTGTYAITMAVIYIFVLILKITNPVKDLAIMCTIITGALLLVYFVIDRVIISLVVLIISLCKKCKKSKKIKVSKAVKQVKKESQSIATSNVENIVMDFTRKWLAKNLTDNANRYEILISHKLDFIKELSSVLKSKTEKPEMVADEYFNKFAEQWK